MMKAIKKLGLLLLVGAIIVATSCGSSDDSSDTEPTGKELTLEALSGNWTVDSGSQFGNLAIDASASTISVFETGFTVSGDLEPYVSGGTFTVNAEGDFDNVQVTVASNLELTGSPSIEMNSSKSTLTISFETSVARVAGLGNFSITLVKQ